MSDDRARPQPDGSDLRPLAANEVSTVAASTARAFADNPGVGWAVRNREARPERLRDAFEFSIGRIWFPRGECLTTHDLTGVACWAPPGAWHLPLGLQLRLLPAFVRAMRGDTARLLTFLALTEAKHPRAPDHWYLALLSVDPAHQGRGFGSHLMGPGLRRCDEDGTPAYLETDTERNVALYERHGFRVTGEFRLPGGGPPIWLMWRDPA